MNDENKVFETFIKGQFDRMDRRTEKRFDKLELKIDDFGKTTIETKTKVDTHLDSNLHEGKANGEGNGITKALVGVIGLMVVIVQGFFVIIGRFLPPN